MNLYYEEEKKDEFCKKKDEEISKIRSQLQSQLSNKPEKDLIEIIRKEKDIRRRSRLSSKLESERRKR